MEKSMTIEKLAQEVDRQNKSKRDFLASTKLVDMTEGGSLKLEMGEGMKSAFAPTAYCHEQIGERLGIPKKYYDRMLADNPDLLRENVNSWFHKEPELRLIRTLDGKARAFLSNKYRPMDNWDLLQATLPVLSQNATEVLRGDLTETRLYLKVLFPKVQAEIKKGDVVQAGVMISNSEVGAGAYKVEPFTFRLACLNGMIHQYTMNKYHVRRGLGGDEESIYEILTDATRTMDDKALIMKVQDVLRHSLTDAAFQANVERFKEAAQEKFAGDLVKTVEQVNMRMNFTESQGAEILKHLIEGSDLTKWGLANAVTRTAQDQDGYDEQIRLERAGGRIIELPKTEWEALGNN